MATNGQSAAVAAQYMLSGQQNQFCSGQHPAGHMVLLLHGNKWTVSSCSSTVHVVWAAEPVLLWAASSGAHGSITLLLSSHLDKLLFHGNHWAISFSSSTAEPVDFWATSSGAHGSLTLLLGSHLDKLLLHGNKWTVSSSSSTVHVVWAAEPVLLWATSSG